MIITLVKYNVMCIVLFVGMTMIHSSLQDGSPNEKPIKLYFSHFSPVCRSVLMLGKILKLNFIEKPYTLLNRDHLQDKEFLAINPHHVVPTIHDLNNDIVLWESRAILQYLVQKYGGEDNPLYPKDIEKQAKINKILQFDLGTLMDSFADLYTAWAFFKTPKTEFKIQRFKKALKDYDTLLTLEVKNENDPITVADVALAATIVTIETTTKSISDYPNISKWFAIVKEKIPEFTKVNEIGLKTIEDKVNERNQEDLKNIPIQVSISNQEVYNAVSTLISAIRYQVLSREHLIFLVPLERDLASLLNKQIKIEDKNDI